MKNPGHMHWEAVKDIIWYLKGTADDQLTLGTSNAGLEAYIDVNWASQPHWQLMSGYTVYLHGLLIVWSARKQSLIALSTAKAEYITLTAAACKVLHLQTLLNKIYGPVLPPIPIYCDNQGAITLALKNKFHACTKHIDIWYHSVRHLIWTWAIDLTYCPTEENVVHVFTKPLPWPQLQKLPVELQLSPACGGVFEPGLGTSLGTTGKSMPGTA